MLEKKEEQRRWCQKTVFPMATPSFPPGLSAFPAGRWWHGFIAASMKRGGCYGQLNQTVNNRDSRGGRIRVRSRDVAREVQVHSSVTFLLLTFFLPHVRRTVVSLSLLLFLPHPLIFLFFLLLFLKPYHEEDCWSKPCPHRRLLVGMVPRWRARCDKPVVREGNIKGRTCLDNMTVFNQENVEEFYEIGNELGRWVSLWAFSYSLS